MDDHPLFREGLAVALGRESDLEIVGEAGDAVEAIALATRMELDVAVVDVLMPTVSGLGLASELFELQPNCRVLALSVIDEPCIIADMLRAHACGFALKNQPVAEIVDAIRQVLGGLRYLPPSSVTQRGRCRAQSLPDATSRTLDHARARDIRAVDPRPLERRDRNPLAHRSPHCRDAPPAHHEQTVGTFDHADAAACGAPGGLTS